MKAAIDETLSNIGRNYRTLKELHTSMQEMDKHMDDSMEERDAARAAFLSKIGGRQGCVLLNFSVSLSFFAFPLFH